ncbi:carbohydrate ABC transporter permease [Paenibacillus qinlingensis]|uniref:Aldouronate transport system permease protein n=1 Tax=Paenibacillus qinlingensis TaxID=1837343 RepID=A0ABU1NWB4_9BACL|nr:carbohydrate ABC transporter permease [Paenibacillus qinlingensis]MDR6551757.1 putative aldouronate transport system permease protein [Paenibacillus qinlingensis]
MKPTKGEKLFAAFNYAFLVLLCVLFLVPFWTVFATSFVSEAEAVRRGAFILFPEQWNLLAYRMFLKDSNLIFHAYQVTLFRVIVGTALNLIVTSMLAYGLARRTLPGRNAIVTFIFVQMVFSGGMIPTYLLMDAIGLKGSIWVLIIPGLVSAWNMFIMRTFFMNIPAEIEEAAIMDGANAAGILWRIILPLSKPAFVTIGLFYAVGHWNAWFDAAIYLNDVKQYPMQLILRNILSSGISQEDLMPTNEIPPPAATIKAAAIMISTIPILFVYPFIQKYFVKGAMIGSVKG